jgi:enoyl-CoA hydratase
VRQTVNDSHGRKEIHRYTCQDFTSILCEGEMTYEVDTERHTATITFNRPEHLNAMPIAGLEYLTQLIKLAERDDDVRVIVLRGSGPCFGVGADANELGWYIGYGTPASGERQRPPAQRRRMLPDRDVIYGSHGFEQAIWRCFKPTICEVHSYCYGGHLQMAVAADIVIASEDALFAHPAWRYLGPIFNFPLMIETLGLKKTKELVLTCRPLDAGEAEKFGLVTRAVPREELVPTVDKFVSVIAARNLDGIAMGKAVIEQALEARGAGQGGLFAWAGHSWMTNLRHEKGEHNFVKSRRDRGLTEALDDLDRMVAPEFRMGKARTDRR